VVSPLAEGADRLVATEVLDWPVTEGIEKPVLEVLLPMPAEEYIHTFGNKGQSAAEPQASVNEFQALLNRAQSVKVVADSASSERNYEPVGRAVVDSCNLLVAVWDGEGARGKGGTEQIVEYARHAAHRSLVWINSRDGTIKEERYGDGIFEALERLDAYNAEFMEKGEDRFRNGAALHDT
jgi:hypothetical protein